MASTESTTPAFAAPPVTCAALNRTVLYAVIPTASSEVSDTPPRQPVQIDPAALNNSLPVLLSSSQTAPGPCGAQAAPAPGQVVDYRWVSDDFVNATLSVSQAGLFRGFSLALRMLHTVFGAFDGTPEGKSILAFLNQYNVSLGTFGPNVNPNVTTHRAISIAGARRCALGRLQRRTPPIPRRPLRPRAHQSPGSRCPAPAGYSIPANSPLVTAMIAALTPRSQNILAPQGRFQDSTRQYRLRLFFRIKGETPGCPPELVWSHYSEPFRIAAWHEAGERSHPPIPLPDPTSAFLSSAKPNCAFQVPGSLMGAMQGASLSGLMKGSGGGTRTFTLNWICGFNIPLITICAFFVLNIFLSLLNIIFFWLPFIKICIPGVSPAVPPAHPTRAHHERVSGPHQLAFPACTHGVGTAHFPRSPAQRARFYPHHPEHPSGRAAHAPALPGRDCKPFSIKATPYRCGARYKPPLSKASRRMKTESRSTPSMWIPSRVRHRKFKSRFITGCCARIRRSSSE